MHDKSVIVHTYIPSTQELEARESEVPSHPQLYSKFKGTLR